MTCRARQYSDQMNCHVCNLVWDMNDADPPLCGATTEGKAERNKRRATEFFNFVKTTLRIKQ